LLWKFGKLKQIHQFLLNYVAIAVQYGKFTTLLFNNQLRVMIAKFELCQSVFVYSSDLHVCTRKPPMLL